MARQGLGQQILVDHGSSNLGSLVIQVETFKATSEKVVDLHERFTQIISFVDEDTGQACNRQKATLIDKFLDKKFSINFI